MVAITPPDEPCTVSAIFSDPCSPSFEEPWANAAAPGVGPRSRAPPALGRRPLHARSTMSATTQAQQHSPPTTLPAMIATIAPATAAAADSMSSIENGGIGGIGGARHTGGGGGGGGGRGGGGLGGDGGIVAVTVTSNEHWRGALQGE